MSQDKNVRLTFVVNPAMDAALEALMEQTGSTKSDVLRKAVAILQVAVRAKSEGRRFGIAAEGQELATEIVGL